MEIVEPRYEKLDTKLTMIMLKLRGGGSRPSPMCISSVFDQLTLRPSFFASSLNIVRVSLSSSSVLQSKAVSSTSGSKDYRVTLALYRTNKIKPPKTKISESRLTEIGRIW